MLSVLRGIVLFDKLTEAIHCFKRCIPFFISYFSETRLSEYAAFLCSNPHLTFLFSAFGLALIYPLTLPRTIPETKYR